MLSARSSNTIGWDTHFSPLVRSIRGRVSFLGQKYTRGMTQILAGSLFTCSQDAEWRVLFHVELVV